MNAILCPPDKTINACLNFFENAGYEKSHFGIKAEQDKIYLIPRVQVFLAQDSIAFGFKGVKVKFSK